jgi:hypothetical protein
MQVYPTSPIENEPNMVDYPTYPLVNVYTTMERSTML